MTVIIPAYKPPESFPDEVLALTRAGLGVLVVDDGSGLGYKHVFDTIEERTHAEVLHRTKNGGKGRALRDAFSFCSKKYSENHIFVTADADGQHTVEDIIRVGYEAKDAPNSLVLGVRDFSVSCVPKRSRFGNRFTRALFRFVSGVRLTDTQTGLRAFSGKLFPVLLSARGDGFEYETDVLIRAVRAGVTLKEVPIETVYAQEHVSAFRTVRDSLRVLRTLLGSVGRFVFVGAICGALDLLLFYAFSTVFSGLRAGVRYLLSVGLSRILSSLVNLCLGAKYVFGKFPAKAPLRYYTLWFARLGAVYFATVAAAAFLPTLAQITVAKGVTDFVLSLLSYKIEATWVFQSGGDPESPGPYYRIAIGFLRLFVHKKRVQAPSEPTVYLCRHRWLTGPLHAAAALSSSVRIWILSPFFRFDTAFDHYKNVTFRKLPILRFLLAFLGALTVPPLMRSGRCIPVYRGSLTCEETMKRTKDAVLHGESVLIFPETAYKSKQPSPLYEGFVKLARDVPQVPFSVLVFKNGKLRPSSPVRLCDSADNTEAAFRVQIEKLLFANQ